MIPDKSKKIRRTEHSYKKILTKVGRGEPFGWNRVKKRCKKEKRILGLQLCNSELKRLNERLHIHTDDYSSKARPLPIKTGATL